MPATFTLKHIERDGFEGLIQASSVIVYPKGHNPLGIKKDEADKNMVISFGSIPNGGATDTDGVTRYASGKLFVMNEFGATVAKYDLD